MADNEEANSLGEVNTRLYQPKPVDGVRESTLSTRIPKNPEGWKHEDPLPVLVKKPGLPGSAVFLIFAAGFFILAGLVAAIVLFLGGRSVSGDRLEISVDGPATISGGESVPILITIRNGNPTVARGASLEIDFPEGTFEGENASIPLPHFSEELGDIAAGETVRRTVRAAFFGEENQRVTVPIEVEYTTGNSNATFVSEKAHGFVISTAPVTLSVNALSETSSGEPFTVVVKARSNATAPIENVAVKLERYPTGFTPTEQKPEPEGTVYRLGTFAPGEEKEVRVTGILRGQDGDERTFKFFVGTMPEGASEFGVSYSSKDAIVALAAPFLSVGLAVNRDDTDPIILKVGRLASALVSWENSLPNPVLDGRIAVTFSGEALDATSVEATSGYYRSSDKTVLFDRDTTSGLSTLQPGDSGNGTFVFTTKTGAAMDALRNPTIEMVVSISGRRVGQGNVAENVTSTLTRTVKIETDLTLTAKAVRTVGPFENTGPWPPVADTETTYTIQLEAGNTVNTAANSVVKMTLPSYVRFTGKANPAASVKFNETTREVTWALGDMAPGTKKEAAFQVALLPSVSQQGTSPVLTSPMTISGYDRFVEQETVGEANAVSTQTLADPEYKASLGTVQYSP